MLVFDFVLRGAWKPMSKSMGSGAAWMLILVVATMFVAVDSSLLLSDEKKPGCLSGRKFEGACKDLNVDVTSKSGTIKATMSVKEGDKDFDGSISVGSCNIDGKFLGLKGFQAKEISSSFASPIKIVATATEVTLQGTQAPIQACKSAPFELEEDKSVKTNVKLHVDTGNIVSLQLDPSVDVGNEHHEEPGFWTRTWNSMPPWLWIIIFIICFVLLGLIVTGIVFAILRFCCCCKKPEKADLKASNANLENGNKQMVAHAKVPNGPKDKLPNADKKPEADVKGEKKDNEAVKKDNEAVKKDEKGPEVKPKDEKKVAVAPNPSNVNAAAPNPSNVNAAAPNPSNVNAAAPNPSNVNAAAPNPSNVNAAAPNPSNVNAAAPNPSNVNVAVTPKKSKEKKASAVPSFVYTQHDFPTGPYPKDFLELLLGTFMVLEWSNYKLFYELLKFLLVNPLSDAQYDALVDEVKHWETVVREKTEKGKQAAHTKAYVIMMILHAMLTIWNSYAKQIYESKTRYLIDEDNTQRETRTDITQEEIAEFMAQEQMIFTMPPNTDEMDDINWKDVHKNFEKLSKQLLDCFDVAHVCQYQLEGHMHTMFDNGNRLKHKEAEVLRKKLAELKPAYQNYLKSITLEVDDKVKLYQIIDQILATYEDNKKKKTKSWWHIGPFTGWDPDWQCCRRNRRRR